MYEQNKWYVTVSSYYMRGFYTKEQVKKFVPRYISEEEYQSIIAMK